jgi:hypothetical protein
MRALKNIVTPAFAAILGGSIGGGKPTFRGMAHEFKIGGLTAGANVGVAKMSAGGLQLNVGSASGVKVSMK